MEYWMSSFSSKSRTKNRHIEVIVEIGTFEGLFFTMYFPNFYCFRDYIAMNRPIFEMILWNVRYLNKDKCYRVKIFTERKS